MPIEIKELVIRTVLEKGTKQMEDSGSISDLKREIQSQLKRHKSEIMDQCIEAINEGLKRQNER